MTEQQTTKPAQTEAIDAPAPEAEKHHVERTGWRKLFPQSFLDNSTRISNAGLFFFTGSMLHSGYRGKQISHKLYDEQIGLLKTAGYEGERLAAKTAELIKDKVIIEPGWHKMRLIYLITACTSFAFGAAFKRKEEKQEDLARYEQMSLPSYMVERTKEAFNPTEHSRQTVGVVAGISGVMAVTSALSQPGGVHKSELFVGSLLALGGALLAYIKDAVVAQKAFTFCWMARLPAIVTGSKESVWDYPAFRHPLIAEMKTKPEFFEGMQKAYNEGHPEKILLNGWTVERKGGAAAKAFDASYGKIKLEDRRYDVAYPFGQWGNLYSAVLGIAGKKKAPKKDAVPTVAPAIATDDNAKPVAAHHDATLAEAAQASATPSTKVGHVEAQHERVEAKELAQQMSA